MGSEAKRGIGSGIAMPTARIGISGWRYPGWRGDFYPVGLPQRQELEFAAGRLQTIEINGSFYSLQRPTSYASWHAHTPDDFVFAVKGPRFITHIRRLTDARVPLANFFASGVLALGAKLGPILWQLPATLACDRDVLARFIADLPHSTTAAARLATEHDDRIPPDRALCTCEVDQPVHHALEARHASFADSGAIDLLREFGIATVLADSAGTWPEIDADTASVRYARLHGAGELHTGGYGPGDLATWAARIRGWLSAGRDAYVYFDNDVKVRAPFDAMALQALLRGA